MHIACPRCDAVLEFNARPPAFCSQCGHSLPAPDQLATAAYVPAEVEAPAVPEAVGGYRLLRRLGGGGMGAVYEAEEAASGRRVAVKLIAPEYAESPEAVQRFRQEGRLASAIAHPRCVFVLAADEEAGQPYIVMELMPGATLEGLVEERGPLPPEEAVAKLLDVIDGLREAHRLGVVHRDLKPSNCFLEADGRVKVGDFGLSKSLTGQSRLTVTGAFLGTLLFAPPEQVRGERVDHQSDLYAVAATLYYLLAGRAPFQGGDAAAVLARTVADPVPPLRGLRPEVPAALERVVLRGLERDRQRRWRDLDELRAALLPFAPGRLSVGGVGLRFGAYLIDNLALTPVAFLQMGVALWLVGTPGHQPLLMVNAVLGLLFALCYYGVPEGLWGCSLGKFCLRLRVWPAGGWGPPGLPRALWRTGLWIALLSGPATALEFLTDTRDQAERPLLALLVTGGQLFVQVAGVVLIVSTMRARNGYRCLHDVLSGTRVVRLPEPEGRRAVPARRLDEGLSPAESGGRVGGFAVRGALWRADGSEVLLGEDPALGRQVVLWLRPPAAPPLDAARRDLSRAGRLRWLAGGRQGDRPWDAFPAPAGCSVSDLVARAGRLPWPEARHLLEQLTEELAAACASGTLPPALSAGQVWVQSNGQVVLLDVPLGAADDGAAGPPGDAPPDERALALLRQAAVLALEGRPRRPGDTGPIRAPVPEHAGRLLRPLLGDGRPYARVKQVQAALDDTRDKPREVTRPRRLAHLAVQALFLTPCLILMAVGGCTHTIVPPVVVGLASRDQEQVRRDLEEGAWRELVVGAVGPNPTARLRALAQLDADLRLGRRLDDRLRHTEGERQALRRSLSRPAREYDDLIEQVIREITRAPVEEMRGKRQPWRTFRLWASVEVKYTHPLDFQPLAVFAAVMMVFPLVLLALWAFAVRGGMSFRVSGLALVGADGRPAARWRCAWRAVLVWAPVVLLLLAGIGLDVWGRSAVDAPGRAWVPWASFLCWWAPGVLVLAYGALALRRPGRAPHDRLAGTWLVPR
jgi:hypothetical protein